MDATSSARKPFEQRLGALAAQLEPLARAAQPVERRGRLLATAGGVGELLLGAAPLFEQRLELLVGVLARKDGRRAPALAVFEPLAQLREIELCDTRSQRRDLPAQLLGALGRGRLERERPQPLLHLGFDVTRALDLDRDARELQLGAMLAALEASEPGRLLEQRAPLLRLRRRGSPRPGPAR